MNWRRCQRRGGGTLDQTLAREWHVGYTACLAAEMVDEPQDQADDHADDQARDQRKVKCAVWPEVTDVTGQSTQAERQFWSPVEETADQDERGSDGEQQAAELLDRFHRDSVAPAELCLQRPRSLGLRFLWDLRRTHGDKSLHRVRREVVKALRAKVSGSRDAAYEIVLLGDGFRADGECVEDSKPERRAKRFILTVAQRALAENFHSDDGFSAGLHF